MMQHRPTYCAAERDYFTLRERIETITKQLTGLQQYVREQCLNNWRGKYGSSSHAEAD
jgi:hypothetical protein